MSASAVRTLLLAALCAAWEILPRAGVIPALFLSPLSASIEVAFHSYSVYIANLWTTLLEIALALLIACGGGVVLGGALGAFPYARGVFLPLISSVYAIPFVVLYPLITVWLGIGSASKIAFAGIYGLIPTLLTTAAGVQSIDRNLIVAARSIGAGGFTLVAKVMLPATIPAVLAAIKIGAALVVVGVVVGEMLVSTAGIGYLIAQNRTTFNTPEVYLAIVVVLGIAWTLERAISMLERHFANWSLHTRKST